MHHDMKRFVREILKSPRRRAIPIMTSPGIDLIGAKPVEVFRDGALQFRCIQALAGAVHADALVTFMDLSVEAEAFGSPVRYSEHENPTVSGSIASTPEAIDALAVPEVGAKRTAEVLRCAELCAANLDRPVLGGMIGPFSLAGRLADMTEIMILAAMEPEAAARLLGKTTAFLTGYAKAIRSKYSPIRKARSFSRSTRPWRALRSTFWSLPKRLRNRRAAARRSATATPSLRSRAYPSASSAISLFQKNWAVSCRSASAMSAGRATQGAYR